MALGAFLAVNQKIIAVEIIIFNIFGLFGNLNFIFLTARRSNLRSKSSYLQCILCFSHIICLLSELLNATLLFTGIQLKRNECLPMISFYVFSSSAQQVIILMMTIDIFVIVFMPSFYRTCATWKYLVGMMIIPVCYSSLPTIWGLMTMDDELVAFCNPPVGLHPTISRIWTISCVVVNSITLCLFITLLLIFYYKGKQQKSDTRKVMRRLKVSILFFIFSWYIGMLAVDFFSAVGLTGDALFFSVSNMVFFVLLSFTQFFYVVIWRSPEYRNAFFDTWSWIPACWRLKEKYAKKSKVSAITQSQQPCS